LVREAAIISKNLQQISDKGWFSSYRFGPQKRDDIFYTYFGKVYATESE